MLIVPSSLPPLWIVDGDGGGAAGYSGGGASGYGRRTATPSSAGSQIKRPRVTTDGPSGRSQVHTCNH